MAVNTPKPLPQLTQGQIERFWSKVDKRGPDECWPWTAGSSHNGYGRWGFKLGCRACAHRVSFVLAFGPIPNGMYVMHRCDNPPCCNPAHLFTGTTSDNSADKVAKGRQAKGDNHGARTRPERWSRGDSHYSRLRPERLARGEKNGSAKLTESDVRKIRRLAASGMSHYETGAIFGIAQATVWGIVHRITWKHVP